jgi:predicted  nucleic acid-binding Zn ribbon protein
MFTAQIKFPNNANADQGALVEESYWLLGVWYKNGQILSDHWPFATTSDGLMAHVLIPAVNALNNRFANRYVRDAIRRYQKLTSMRPEVVVLGLHPESAPACACSNRPGYVLFTNYLSTESPVRCSKCFRPVPLYSLPPTHDEEYLDILGWMADYKACDTLQMHCTVGERFGEKQLFNPDSALSKQGRNLCRILQAKVKQKVYYYLHKSRGRSLSEERKRPCPVCRRKWLLDSTWHNLFHFRCEYCRLVSNIASSLGM